MKPLRWLAAGLVWVVAGLLGLVGVLLSVTVILLPIGIPVLMLARRLFSLSSTLVLPRAVRHPVQETGKAAGRQGKQARKAMEDGTKGAGRAGRKALKQARGSKKSPVAAVLPRRRRGVLGRLGLRRR
jgi:membrane protein implicated in regulation of membrane protease activity